MDKRKARLKELKSKLEEFRKQQSPLVKEKNEIEEQISTEQNEVLIGKCFKYRNSYGSGEKWWYYTKVIKAGNWDVTIISIQETSANLIEIKRETHAASSYYRGGNYIEVTKKEFNREFLRLLGKIQKDI